MSSNKGQIPWNKGIPQSDEAKKKNSEAHKGQVPWNKGNATPDEIKQKISDSCKGRTGWNKGMTGYKTKPCSEERKRKISDALKGNQICLGRKHSEETKRKIGDANRIKMTGTKQSEETIKKRSEAMKGKNTYKRSPETRQKMSEARKGLTLSEEHRKRISERMQGHVHSEETKRKIAETKVGDKNPMYGMNGEKHHNWQNGISFEPYCPKFNKQLKEKIRDRDNRTCQLCGKKEDGTLLSIHHISYDKPNCYPHLVALCRSCNCKVNFNRDYWEALFMSKLKERGLIE